MISWISRLTGSSYRFLLKPILFSLPPDWIHEPALSHGEMLSRLGIVRSLFTHIYRYSDPSLHQSINGIALTTPVGLSAGYDYNGSLPNIMGPLGFGFTTVGSVTLGAYEGNKPPMFGRLPLSQSLWVNKGFKNPGAVAVRRHLDETLLPANLRIPLGVSIGATNKTYPTEQSVIAEYINAFKEFSHTKDIAYFELNISCPNLQVKQSFTDVITFEKLVKAVTALKLKQPIFVKMPIDIDQSNLLELLDIIAKYKLAGSIIGNLTKTRFSDKHLYLSEANKFVKGGFSGKATQAYSDRLIRAAYLAHPELSIIGCGGVFSARDAFRKIQLGANCVQMITGMIYEGPQVVGQISQGVAKLLREGGYQNITQARGILA